MKINFPEDRALFREAAGRGEITVTLPRDTSTAMHIASDLHTVKEIAFAALFIFFRTLQLDALCVKVRLKAEPPAADTDNALAPDDAINRDYFVSARLSNTETLSQSFASAEFSDVRAAGASEIDILICDAADSEGLVSEVGPQGNLLICSIQDKRLHLKLDYQKRLLAGLSASDFLEKIGVVLAAMANGPALPSQALSLLTASSAQRMPDLAQPIEARRFDLLPVTFFAVADQYAEQPAIAGLDFEYSYRFLKNHCIGIINDLTAAGVCVGDVVSIRGASSLGTIASILAVMAVGGVVVIIDHLLPDDRKKLIADISQPAFNIEVGAQDSGNAAPAKTIRSADWPDPQAVQNAVLNAPLANGSDCVCAYVFFTSGSSGIPKGVLGSHQGLAHFLDWQRGSFPIGPGDRTAQLTALSFDVVLRDLFYPLTSGACIHIPKREILLDARKMLGWMKETQITAMHCVPSLMRAWLLADAGNRPFQSLKYIFFAGEPLTDSLLRRFREASGDATQITNLYGPTETTLAKLSHRIQHIEDGIQPVGNPQPGVDVLILKDRRTLCGLWETGEIAIRTPYRSRGYFQNPALTQQAFEKNPWRDDAEDLIYFTGDLGRYRSDGKVEIFGRIDSQIKIRGVRIEPNEIESCILSFPGMKDAAVTTRTGPSGDKILLAVAVPESFVNFDPVAQAKRLREALKGKLHDAMVPARIMFLERLPYLPNGKLDRKSIGTLDFDAAGQDTQKSLVKPQVDKKLGRIISEIEETLGIQVSDLGKSFVDLGGDSLSYIRISFVIEDVFGVLPLEWELIPLGMLGAGLAASHPGGQNEKPSRWVSMEPSILLRALSIFFVVLGHSTNIQIVGTSTLFVISGMSFGKFFRRDLLEKGELTPVFKFILRFGIPAGIWEILAAVTKAHPFWVPDFILMGTYFHNPNETYYTLWFLDVLAANILIVSLITVAFGKFSTKETVAQPKFSFDYILVLFGLLLSFLQVGTGWWDGVISESSVAPFKWIWMLALGVAITQAANIREKSMLSLLLGAIALAQLAPIPLIAGSFEFLDTFFFGSVLALVWLHRILIPRMLRHAIISIASASLFIYIVNVTVIRAVVGVLDFEGNWLLGMGAALATGICGAWVWARLEALAKHAGERFKARRSLAS